MKILVCVAFLSIAAQGISQETRGQQQAKTNELHKSRSAISRFDHNLLDSETEKERRRMEQERQREQLLTYLDTASISQSLKRNILSDMDKNPFSGRFKKFMLRYRKDMKAARANNAMAQQK